MRSLLVLSLLLIAAPGRSADYWPLYADGTIYHYPSHAATYRYAEPFTIIDRDYASGCWGGESYIEVEGRACLCAVWSGCPGDFEGAMLAFDPPLPLIPVDLVPGSTWLWESGQHRYPFAAGFVVGQVVSEEEVSVPAGTFTCLHVTLIGLGAEYSGDFYLDRDRGPVIWYGDQLVSIDGQTPTESTSWGGVKSLFR